MIAESLTVLELVGCVFGSGWLRAWGSSVLGAAVGKILVLKQFLNFDRR